MTRTYIFSIALAGSLLIVLLDSSAAQTINRSSLFNNKIAAANMSRIPGKLAQLKPNQFWCGRTRDDAAGTYCERGEVCCFAYRGNQKAYCCDAGSICDDEGGCK